MFKINFRQVLIFMLMVFIIKIVVADPMRKQYQDSDQSNIGARIIQGRPL